MALKSKFLVRQAGEKNVANKDKAPHHLVFFPSRSTLDFLFLWLIVVVFPLLRSRNSSYRGKGSRGGRGGYNSQNK
jgi:hypothetical protein